MRTLHRHAAKRVLDVAGALFLLVLVLVLPILAVAAAAIRLDSPGRGLFRQPRVGRDGSVFGMLKLRTMRICVEEYVPKRLDDPRSQGSAASCTRRASTTCRSSGTWSAER